jgi:site-specific recombinase XerD
VGRTLSTPYADIYDGFLAYQKPRTADITLYNLKSRAYLIIKWFEEQETALEEASVQDALRYKEELNEAVTAEGKQFNAGTVNNFLATARILFEYLVISERRLSNPFKEIPFLSQPFRLCRNYLTETQMLRLLSKLMRFDEAKDMQSKRRRYRVHVIAEILYATGLRQHELALVQEKHIDLCARTIFIPCGKGELSRTVFLTGFAVDVLERYLAKGRAAAMPWYKISNNSEYVFGSHIEKTVKRELLRMCKELELPVITCHGFRHSLGTHLLRAGCDIRHIQVLLGHQNISSTVTYTHLDKDDLKKSLDAYHPRQWKAKFSQVENL